jgi:hypothetical protein
MPAVIPARLKLQSEELASLFSQSKIFMRKLVDLLENYADRTHRQSQSGTPNPLIASYHVPQPVIRQLLISLRPSVESAQITALELCDQLWAHPYLETRTLAAYFLGWLTDIQDEQILDKVIAWQSSAFDEKLLRTIILQGFSHLLKTKPDYVMQIAQGWVKSTKIRQQQAGLITLETLVCASDYENLPFILVAASPFFRKCPLELSSTIVALVLCLVEKYPREATYALQESLQASENPDTARLIRQILSSSKPENKIKNEASFSEDLQLSLRQSLRNEHLPDEKLSGNLK